MSDKLQPELKIQRLPDGNFEIKAPHHDGENLVALLGGSETSVDAKGVTRWNGGQVSAWGIREICKILLQDLYGDLVQSQLKVEGLEEALTGYGPPPDFKFSDEGEDEGEDE